MNINHLKLSWSTSRGQDTYGYNICRLDDRNNGKRYRCMGGGYDMVGTVFGEWLQKTYQKQLLALAKTSQTVPYAELPNRVTLPNLYGFTWHPHMHQVILDGAAGLSSMIAIAEAIGLEVERDYVKAGRNRGDTLGWFVSEKEV